MDKTTKMLLDKLRELLAEEPEVPDHDKHGAYYYQTVARRYEDWDRQCSSFRFLLGVRLTHLALDGKLDEQLPV